MQTVFLELITIKTLILNGSPRKNGDTSFLINKVISGLDGEYKLVNAYYSNISPCIDCRACRYKNGCSINDDMNTVYSYIEECDNILIASPLYFSELTGRLLDAASRLQMYFSAKYFGGNEIPIKRKRGAVILTGGGMGKPDKAYDTAVMLLHNMNAFDICPPVYSLNTDKIPACEDKNALSQAERISAFFNLS